MSWEIWCAVPSPDKSAKSELTGEAPRRMEEEWNVLKDCGKHSVAQQCLRSGRDIHKQRGRVNVKEAEGLLGVHKSRITAVMR